ncbi:MAG: type II secretion system protein [Limisphaerales bacterium]|jgi:prepilin-type N-terminal cleavage/methylation domain-containing protein/prepilin-type processing-associated H-X9-DG protein
MRKKVRRVRLCRGYTLVELLVTLAVVSILAALLLPALARSRSAARRVQCLSQLRQLGIAGQLYWDDHGGNSFPYRGAATNGGDIYWFGWLARGAEGERAFDRRHGALEDYIAGSGVEVCPSLTYGMKDFKLKARGAAYGYGYNLNLASTASAPGPGIFELPHPSGTAFLGDAAQVNTFQPPASPDNPMLEEFYYLSRFEPTAHFRHDSQASVVFVDGHAGAETWEKGSLDQRMPQHHVARLRTPVLTIEAD